MSNWLRRFACKMGWHGISNIHVISPPKTYPVIAQAQCPYCGMHGMLDSQGMLFRTSNSEKVNE